MNVLHVLVSKRASLYFGWILRNKSGRYETFRQLVVLHVHGTCNEIKNSCKMTNKCSRK
jgi:hypothetical protein